MSLPPPPGLRRPMHEDFRIRVSQDTSFRRRVPRVLLSGAPPRRSSAPAAVDARGSDFSSPRDRHGLPGVLRPSGVLQWGVASVRGSQAAIVAGACGLPVALAGRELSSVRLAARPGFTSCPVPSSRLPFPPARRVSSWRHPWDFSLQRSDLVPSRVASRPPLPFFSLVGHPVVPRWPESKLLPLRVGQVPAFPPVVPSFRTRVIQLCTTGYPEVRPLPCVFTRMGQGADQTLQLRGLPGTSGFPDRSLMSRRITQTLPRTSKGRAWRRRVVQPLAQHAVVP